MDESPVGELPAKGLRVCALEEIKDHGLNKTCIPAMSGGTIIYQDDNMHTYAVKWDGGQTTAHRAYDFGQKLVCIGHHRSLQEYLK
jgi:hypothetical protein